ncbi:MAG: hypothetical protein ABEJ28_11650 [Salinigranum sp.]
MREAALERLTDPEERVYAVLKRQHIENRTPGAKRVSFESVERRVSVPDVREVVDRLTEEGLAVRAGEEVMWRPRLSPPAQRALDRVRERDADASAVDTALLDLLVEIGLLTRHPDGTYRYDWSDDEGSTPTAEDAIERRVRPPS